MVLSTCLFCIGNLISLIPAAVPVGPAADRYFVAVNGDDAWSGALPEPNADDTDGPFATPGRALDALRQRKREGHVGGTVFVRGGTYYLTEPLIFTPEDSGTEERPVRFEAYPGETVLLSGGRPIMDWTKGEGGIWTARLPDVQAGRWYFQQLRVGDERQIRARIPDFDPEEPYKGGWLFVPETGEPDQRDRFRFRPGELPLCSESQAPEIVMFPAWGWVSTILHVDRIDYQNNTIHLMDDSNASQDIRPGNRYYLTNVREALDSPGEWYLDRTAGVLSFWPKSPDFRDRGVVAPALDRVIDFVGDPSQDAWVEYVHIRGFRISDTTYSYTIGVYSPNDAAIWMSGSRHCIVEGNTFINIGGYAARLQQRSERNEFVGNEVAYAGQGGIILIGNTANQPKDNLIAGNWIHHGGQVYRHVAGVYAVTASGTRIAHNRIEHMPRYGISLKSFNEENYSHQNVIEYNEIYFTNLETNDTGAIETLGRDKQDTGNVIQYNLILDVVGLKTTPDGQIQSPYFTWGIYLDDYSSGTTVRGNVVARFDWGGGCIHGGKNNLFENNIFIDGLSHQMRYQVRDAFCANNRFVRNILVYSSPTADLFKHTGRWHANVLAESDNNIFWHAGGAEFFAQADRITPFGSLAQWQEAGYDRHSRVADPLFVNPAQDDYRLKHGSPAFDLGFQPIPWEKIGLKGYDRACRKQ